jgi:hypothetical protein
VARPWMGLAVTAMTAGGAWRRGAAGPEPARVLVVRASLRTAVALGDGVDGLRAARLWMWDATTAPAAGGAWRRGTAGPDLGRAGQFGAWSCILRWAPLWLGLRTEVKRPVRPADAVQC